MRLIPIFLMVMLVLAVSVGSGAAQDATPVAVPTAVPVVPDVDTSEDVTVPQGTTAQDTANVPASAIEVFFVACDNLGVVNLSGSVIDGFDPYYQVFSGPAGTGEPLTTLRQVQVDGAFAFSEQIGYIEERTVSEANTASLRLVIARENNPAAIEDETTVDDVQDGCQGPQNAVGESVDTGLNAPGVEVPREVPIRVRIPGGDFLNTNLEPEQPVVLGARESDRFRSNVPGLIYAECNDWELANPGLIYDTDNITIFWNWFAQEEAQIGDQLRNSIFSVKLNTAALPDANVSLPAQEFDGDLWLFYTIPLGNLRPGHYEVEFRLTWATPISDGYEQFGPGTANPIMAGNCNFDVLRNPENRSVIYNQSYFPSDFPVHDINPQYSDD